MNVRTRTRAVLLAAVVAAGVGTLPARGEDAPAGSGAAGGTVNLVVTPQGGVAVKIPGERPTVLMFVRADQPQSHQALKQVAAVLKDPQAATVLMVLSGPMAPVHARGLAEGYKYPWPIVTDSEFKLSGDLQVHVWPTAIVIGPKGERVLHQPGLSKAFATDLEAHVEFAAGRIDKGALEQRLTVHSVVGDTPDMQASRHLQVAQHLLSKGRVSEAKTELGVALKLGPKDGALRYNLARAFMEVDGTGEALTLLEGAPAETAPPGQVELLRARALVARGKGAQAKEILGALVKGQGTGEAYYLLGVVYQEEKDFEKAAGSFRAAYEAGAAAKASGRD